jgi:hypothetical protein
MNETEIQLVDSKGNTLAEVLATDEEGWFSGRVLSQSIPSDIAKDLSWYDEVVEHQMLSYLDEATAAVESWGLQVRFRDGSIHPVYSIHISALNEVSFRVTPVPSPGCSATTSQPVRG